jgi:hypothetical protein
VCFWAGASLINAIHPSIDGIERLSEWIAQQIDMIALPIDMIAPITDIIAQCID